MAGFTRDNAKQIGSLIVFVCVTLAGHWEIVPPGFEYLKPWIELVGFIGTAVSAWLVAPGRTEWTPEERLAERIKRRDEEIAKQQKDEDL